jgi:RNA-binding protein NOB1
MEKENFTINPENKNLIFMILDTSFFIKLTPLDLNKNKYLTTQYIVNEIRDKKARDFYELNKNFIEIKNPLKGSMKKVSKFAEESNDLVYLSIADLSVMALAYETIKNVGKLDKLNKKPLSHNIVTIDKLKKEANKKDNKKEKIENENKINENKINDKNFNDFDDDDDDGWITPENLYTKLDEMKGIHESKSDKNKIEINAEENNNEEDKSQKKEDKSDGIENVFVNTADFTLQNACMKMGIPIMGVDGLRIKNIKNYILKCTVCNKFIFEIDRKFCDFCGYPYLMKIGYNIFANGEIRINDKEPEPRKRGQVFDLPTPSTKKNGTVYILSEDQIPKKGFDKRDINIDKILENYENFKELPKHDNEIKINSSKQYKWGFPKRNPNIPKKYNNKHKK